ncbi:MAG TPA: DNA repair protein RecO [Candidatus Paceibacterota bacterium]|nr:DNA repair protein RecO [Candidatus Paceibacterota bacterium]HMP19275.1 DNA repair protein RecO [Candidatus Paceibacterota bacterium]HMP85452.1 DNA repair protein RecO [Candidatus Paceibacterota bacterium]
MHHIHRTKAIVLKNISTREVDSQLILFTKEFGKVIAIAQGTRKLNSKMRQSLQDFSLINVALISGRSIWRIVNVSFSNNFFNDIKNNNLKQVIIKVLSLIERFVVDEREEHELFDFLENAINFAFDNQENFDKNLNSAFEIFLTAKALDILGYFSDKDFSEYFKIDLSIELLKKISNQSEIYQKNIIKEINRSIRDSHL